MTIILSDKNNTTIVSQQYNREDFLKKRGETVYGAKSFFLSRNVYQARNLPVAMQIFPPSWFYNETMRKLVAGLLD